MLWIIIVTLPLSIGRNSGQFLNFFTLCLLIKKLFTFALPKWGKMFIERLGSQKSSAKNKEQVFVSLKETEGLTVL